MTKREVVIEALEFRRPPYVPWAWAMTQQCAERMKRYLATDDLGGFIGSHFVDVYSAAEHFERVDEVHVRDVYGVVWDRSVDKDIGTPSHWPIRKPEDLKDYQWPDAADEAWYVGIPQRLAAHRDLFSRYDLSFSLYERAWTMRGMTELLMDMIQRPEFVEDLLDRIVEHNLVQIRKALSFEIDCVYFGDDYGMQTGLMMGIEHWRHFIRPRLGRMFEPVREAGKFVSMHSCGCVAELFDDFIELGVEMFNPFQPEVMDVFALMKQYRGRLAFHGGMSIQRVLPFAAPEEVRQATQKLIDAGCDGGYIFSPSHEVPPDVPPENLIAMMDVLRSQAGYEAD